MHIEKKSNKDRLLKKSFFSQTRPWANKSKILSAGLPVGRQACLKQTGLFLKNNLKTPGGQVLIFELFYGIDELLLALK
ncbi:MAG: hypothetical protein LWW78_00915 [Deltaproteobacteria bacterium]|nr:hypothetical protein [Deltaproteobacteria bacterium]